MDVLPDLELPPREPERLVEPPVVIRVEPGQLAVVEDLVERAQPADVLGQGVLALGGVRPAEGRVEVAEGDHVVELRDHGDRLLEERHGLGARPRASQHLGEPGEGPVVARDRDEGRAVGRARRRRDRPGSSAPGRAATRPRRAPRPAAPPPGRARARARGPRWRPPRPRAGSPGRRSARGRRGRPPSRASGGTRAPPRRSARPRGARPRGRPRRGCPGIDRHRARRLAGGVVELVARVEDVGEVAPRAGLLGLERERSPERPLGEREPARVRGGAELLDVRVAEPVVGPRVGRAPLEPALVGGDGAVRGAVVPARAARASGSPAPRTRGRERDSPGRQRRGSSRHGVHARRSVPAPARRGPRRRRCQG